MPEIQNKSTNTKIKYCFLHILMGKVGKLTKKKSNHLRLHQEIETILSEGRLNQRDCFCPRLLIVWYPQRGQRSAGYNKDLLYNSTRHRFLRPPPCDTVEQAGPVSTSCVTQANYYPPLRDSTLREVINQKRLETGKVWKG